MMTNTPVSKNLLVPRHSHSFTQHRLRWWQGYEHTQGLDAFRADERYAVWFHTHQALLANNASYAADTRWFWMCGLLAGGLTLGLWAYVGLLSTAVTFGLAIATLLCCREQRRRNTCIAEQLRVPA